jgi:hypothetical protein|tara:strand:- start:911 stop:1168 length:258 start_codon:yes stop_codon:yes gene_type:complete
MQEETSVCFTEEEWVEFITEYELDLINEVGTVQPAGDAQAAINFTWELLFLSPWELAYIALPMGVLAFYGLTIYSIFKYIQRRFS